MDQAEGDYDHRRGIVVITLSAQEMERLIEVAQRFGLDFDDAYQYAVAERRGKIRQARQHRHEGL